MRWLFFLVAPALLLVGYTTLHERLTIACDSRPQHPKIRLAMTEIRIPNARPGETVQADFPVHNTGGRRLVVIPQDRSCCKANTDLVVVAPDQTATVHIEFITENAAENKRYQFRFSANDPDLPEFLLTLIVDFDRQPPYNSIEPVPVENPSCE